jgi:predicted transcriptional regulator
MTGWTIEVDDDVARRVTKAAAERCVAPEQLAGEVIAAHFSGGRRLALSAVDACGSARGAAQADELLAEGFGKPQCPS